MTGKRFDEIVLKILQYKVTPDDWDELRTAIVKGDKDEKTVEAVKQWFSESRPMEELVAILSGKVSVSLEARALAEAKEKEREPYDGDPLLAEGGDGK